MYLFDITINFLGILIAAAVYFLLGNLWYSKSLFGKVWRHHEGLHPVEPYQPSVGAYIGEFVIALIIAYIFDLLMILTSANGVVDGLILASWIWVGFIATTQLSAVLWGKKTFKSFLIHDGFILCGFLLIGFILGFMKEYSF